MREALRQIEQSTAKECILLCHFTYFNAQRNEFYSPFDPILVSELLGDLSKASQFSMGHVLMFIDDIYDVYARLTTPKRVFDSAVHLEAFVRSSCREYGLEPDNCPEDTLALLRLRWQARVLQELLLWRQLEQVLAGQFATSVNATFMVWGTKQLTQAATSWLLAQDRLTVYLSHAISRPRRSEQENGVWPEVVAEVNRLQTLLLEHELVAVMPTAIDELRIARNNEVSSLTRRIPRLITRWPLPEPPTALLYEAPRLGGLRRDFAFEEGPPEEGGASAPKAYFAAFTDAVLQSLESSIQAQVSGRDHTFVSLTNCMFVYRPLFESGEISQGVRAEIEHWRQLALNEPRRRIAFIHFEEDVVAYLSAGSADWSAQNRPEDLRDILIDIIHGELHVNADTARRMINHLREPATDLLNTLPELPTKIATLKLRFSEYLAQAVGRWGLRKLRAFEIGGIVPREQIGIWVLKNSADLEKHLSEVAGFFEGTLEHSHPQARVFDIVKSTIPTLLDGFSRPA